MKMAARFGASISTVQLQEGVTPHIVIPSPDLPLDQRDDLLSSLPIRRGHLMMADHHLSFLIALMTPAQKRAIQSHAKIRFVGEVNIDLNALALLVKDGMRILSNPNMMKDVT